MEIKIPRKGTRLRQALEFWLLVHGGEVTFTQFLKLCSQNVRYGMWATACLKRFGRKLGKPGDKSRWVMDGRVAAVLARDLIPRTPASGGQI